MAAIRRILKEHGASLVVSGGCRGVDTWAEDVAKTEGIAVKIFRPQHDKGALRPVVLGAITQRNRRIAEECDILAAFVAPDRKGGTEQTIKHAQRLGKPVLIL